MVQSVIDLHVHTRPYSTCSHLGLKDVLNNLDARISGIGITNHDTLLGVPRYAKNPNWKDGEPILIPGVEITTDYGHILAFGIDALPPKHSTPKQVIDIIHDEGGVAIAAHPFKTGYELENLENLEFNAIEINGKSGRRENREARQVAKLLGLPLVGGSDCHSLKDLNSCVTIFKQEVRKLDDLVYQIQHALCSASWFGFSKE